MACAEFKKAVMRPPVMLDEVVVWDTAARGEEAVDPSAEEVLDGMVLLLLHAQLLVT